MRLQSGTWVLCIIYGMLLYLPAGFHRSLCMSVLHFSTPHRTSLQCKHCLGVTVTQRNYSMFYFKCCYGCWTFIKHCISGLTCICCMEVTVWEKQKQKTDTDVSFSVYTRNQCQRNSPGLFTNIQHFFEFQK